MPFDFEEFSSQYLSQIAFESQPDLERSQIDRSGSMPKHIDNRNILVSNCKDLYQGRKYTDITLLIDDQKFEAHKIILAKSSDVFERMLFGNCWVDKDLKEFRLVETTECLKVFELFLEYLYCGEVTLNTNIVLGLMILADKYNVKDLNKCCNEYMSECLKCFPSFSLVFPWFQYASMCQTDDFLERCLDYMCHNVDVVFNSPDWFNMSPQQLKMMLARSDMIIESEYTLLKAVVSWIQSDSTPEECLRIVLPFIRFPLIFPKELTEFQETKFYSEYSTILAPYLLNAFKHQLLSLRSAEPKQYPEAEETQYMYRNYLSSGYGICLDMIRKGYHSCSRVSSVVERFINIPGCLCNTDPQNRCHVSASFYPKGFFTTSHWNGQINVAQTNNSTYLQLTMGSGLRMTAVDISIAVYAQHNGAIYVDDCLTERYNLTTSYYRDKFIDNHELQCENSRFLIDGGIHIKVFLRPIVLEASDIPIPLINAAGFAAEN